MLAGESAVHLQTSTGSHMLMNLAKTLVFSQRGHSMAPTNTQLVAVDEGSADAPGGPAPPPCPLCDAILAHFAPPRDINHCALELDLASLDRDCPHNAWLKTSRGPSSVGESGRRPHELLKIRLERDFPGASALNLWVQYGDRSRAYGLALNRAELIRRHDAEDHPGTARVLDPAWIDLDIVRGWKARCPQDHGSKCDVVRIPGTNLIRPQWLIDVEQSCIVPGSSIDLEQADGAEPRYLALSYTWGVVADAFRTCRGNLAQVRTRGALLHPEVARCIPATVRDAIGLTRELGERYLWVDSLCIVQDDEQTLLHELGQMHRIYSSAFLTIVAKDGLDASAGLRGIRGVSVLPRESAQAILPLCNGEQLSQIYLKQLETSSTRSYDRRAWTLQEEMFARRRLVFTDGYVEWECPRASWREYFYLDLPEEQRFDPVLTSFDALSGEWMAAGLPNSTRLSELVSCFNSRVLTNEADCLSAFSGLQTALGHIYIGGLLFGLPEFFFDIYLFWDIYKFDWEDTRRRAPRQVDKATGNQGSAPPCFMPSWSWMGWHGLVRLPKDHELSGGYRTEGYLEPLAEWCVMPRPKAFGQKRRIRSEWHLYHQMAQRGDLTFKLEAAGWFLPSNPEEETTGTSGTHCPNRYHRKYTHSLPSGVTYKFNYPFPTMDATTTPAIREQFHYLVAEVHIAEFELTSRTLRGYSNNVIQDTAGNVVGSLTPKGGTGIPGGDGLPTGLKMGAVRLVAVVRGWISLGDFATDLARACAAEVEAAPDYTKADALCSHRRKKECYYVLCVERGADGVYSRTGSGFVLAEAWRNAEKEAVEVVLA
ncbi:HET domain-containing protein [Microdochium nivale]|nr:HET domain-containing protein [Microdochium nivale]